MKSKLLGLLAAGAALLGGATGPAQADNLRAANTTIAQFWTDNLQQDVRLNDNGLLNLRFTNPLAGLVSVTYTAEVQLLANQASFMAISIFIDGQLVVPPSGDTVFISGNFSVPSGGLASHSITVAKSLTAGVHNARVRAQVFGALSSARLDDTTILIAR